MSSPEIILGIDPGLARLGWGVITAQKPKLEIKDFGVVETHSKQPLAERLVSLHEKLQKIIEKHQPDQAAVEKIFFGKNAKTAMMVGEARGVTILTLSESNLQFSEFTPAEIKIALTGYGNADKKQMQMMVKQTLNLKEVPKPDDAADALAVAVTAAVTKQTTIHQP